MHIEITTKYNAYYFHIHSHAGAMGARQKAKDGVSISLKDRNTGNISMISRNEEAVIFGLEKCEKVLLELRS